MKVLFLSHKPHEVHLEFAKAVGAKIKQVNLDWFVRLTKKIPLMSYVYPLVSIFYSFFVRVKEDFLLVDGGSSLYVAAFIKVIHPNIKIIFLNGDLFFYNLKKSSLESQLGKIPSFFYNNIDGIISVSKQSEDMALNYLKVPSEVVTPYPKNIKNVKVKRKNYGLYVGRLDPDKNIKRIVEFGLQCPYFEKFFVVGDGSFRSYIEELSKENSKLVYFGHRKDIERFYSECKFLIHLSDKDPHPCTTMEAALGGCFPIISEGTGTKYLFDKYLRVNDSGNFSEINKKIRYIIDNESELRKELKIQTKRFPTKDGSIGEFINKFSIIFKKIENENRNLSQLSR